MLISWHILWIINSWIIYLCHGGRAYANLGKNIHAFAENKYRALREFLCGFVFGRTSIIKNKKVQLPMSSIDTCSITCIILFLQTTHWYRPCPINAMNDIHIVVQYYVDNPQQLEVTYICIVHCPQTHNSDFSPCSSDTNLATRSSSPSLSCLLHLSQVIPNQPSRASSLPFFRRNYPFSQRNIDILNKSFVGEN